MNDSLCITDHKFHKKTSYRNYNSYEANDGNHIPTTNPYTFENNFLTVDLHFGNELVTPVVFECDGGEAYFETPEYSLFRLNSNCN